MRNLLDQYPWEILSARTSEYRRYLREQKIEKIQSFIAALAMGLVFGAWLSVLILVNL